MTPGRGLALDRTRAALLLLGLALVATAGLAGLFEPTETRYAEIAREMRASGDWLVPRLDGIPHFHKPPLAYWITAAGFALCGTNEWGARLPVALASLLTLGFTAMAARRTFAPLGVRPGLAAWVLGTTALSLAVGRALASDPFLAATVAGFWALAPSPWATALLGLGFLDKGPVVLVPTVLAVLVVAALSRDRAPLARLGPARGWWLFAAIALPWYLIAAASTPGLLRYFLTDQIWARYATTEHQRGGPPWYFVAVLIAGALPWTPALAAGIARTVRDRAALESRLLLAWLLVPLAFFSFSGSKLPAYLLPVFPAVALLAARGLEPGSRAVRGSVALALAALAAAGWLLGPAALARMVGLPAPQRVGLPPAAHAGLACLVPAAVWVARERFARAALLVALGAAALLASLAPYDGPLGSPRAVARVLIESRVPGEPVVEFARFDAGLPFYLRERVRLLEVPREVGPGDPAARAAAFVTRDSLAALVAAHGRVWLLGPEQASRDLAGGLGLGYSAAARWHGSALGVLAR
ncbi:MAG TPA: glycosyltransferase family 39 protein [Candidatus Eisenbacteria bacterium]|jgi:4-amino-4-deoxy-L-arabinose transferase-like glycosyltransferase